MHNFSPFRFAARQTGCPAHRAGRGRLPALSALLVLALLATPLWIPAAAAAPTLVLYNGQHPQTVRLITRAFEKQTGIHVLVHSGEGPAIVEQILRERRRSPADVVFVENSTSINMLNRKGLLAPVPATTLARVPHRYSAPNGRWIAVVARQNVLTWNPALIHRTSLPDTLTALAGPRWKGRIAIAPGDSDFLPLVDAMIRLKGEQAALAWLEGLKRNAKTYPDDEGVVAAVNRGEVATGIINNYYWARLRTEVGPRHMHAEIAHFRRGDVGNLVNVSAAAVLSSAPHKMLAQRFLAFLVSRDAQEILARSNVDYEYPLVRGVKANPVVTPWNRLYPPKIAPWRLGTDAMALRLLEKAGLL
ncbi:MAG: extracellular solute-binding protein [Gammaproteobacteria bacterium]|nr:extracellular solute-binding protein [Gammaproteobacteria bacterium]